jgi:hypothetical protein
LGLEQYLHDCGLEERLLHLIKPQASQINGYAYYLEIHHGAWCRSPREMAPTSRMTLRNITVAGSPSDR